MPEVVFTTAYDQYAVKAFELNALDYLVKPLRDERFSKTIEKVKIELSKRVKLEPTNLPMHQKIFIKDGEKCHFIPLTDIHFIESLEKALDISAIKNLLPMQAGDVHQTFADTSRLEHDYNYKPQISVDKGIQEFVL